MVKMDSPNHYRPPTRFVEVQTSATPYRTPTLIVVVKTYSVIIHRLNTRFTVVKTGYASLYRPPTCLAVVKTDSVRLYKLNT